MESVSQQVDQWIDELELPQSARLKAVRNTDGLYPDDPEESEAYWDFIRFYVNQEYVLLEMIPPQEQDGWKATVELDEFGNDVSAFNTHDFCRQSGYVFDVAGWRHRKVLEAIKSMAITHSVVRNEFSKENLKDRYRRLVENEYWDSAVELKLKLGSGQASVVKRLRALNGRIRDCKRVWAEFASLP